MANKIFLSIVFIFLLSNTTLANTQYIRWTEDLQQPTDLQPILEKINLENNLSLDSSMFAITDEVDLATSHFQTYSQFQAGLPIKGAMIRIWSNLVDGHLIQMEAHLDFSATKTSLSHLNALLVAKKISAMTSEDNSQFIKIALATNPQDKMIRSITIQDMWANNQLIRVIRLVASHGVHTIEVSHDTHKILSLSYQPHLQADIPAYLYKIYEEAPGQKGLQERQFVQLKNLLDVRLDTKSDPFEPLRNRHYTEDKLDPVLGETEEGRADGYWSSRWLMESAKKLLQALPATQNTFANGGVFLRGLYTSINIHPDAVRQFKEQINFEPQYSGQLYFVWSSFFEDGQNKDEVIPTSAFYGQPLANEYSALRRLGRRLPDHSIASYINDGFDEIQVYYAINQFMESFHDLGFVDPELSTRPFHAFLYDPNIAWMNNAYYFNDTINFTSYSPDQPNFARDNSTIWHELGHGVMDRLMGPMIHLSDSGGLAEGMADYLAQLIVQSVTNGVPFPGSDQFRIINQTAFHLTNESHDDGEAYGGAMNDMLTASLTKWGPLGLKKMADLILESMRLTRNHPGLDANVWFDHMLYADNIGHAGIRAPGELQNIVVQSLASRNFSLNNESVAAFDIHVDGQTLTATSSGSRRSPIPHRLNKNELATHNLEISLKSTAAFAFQYPVEVELSFNGGPLQGAVKWKDEANGPVKFTLNSEKDKISYMLSALPGCDRVNQLDGSCSDFVYIKVRNNGQEMANAKKRFYLRIL